MEKRWRFNDEFYEEIDRPPKGGPVARAFFRASGGDKGGDSARIDFREPWRFPYLYTEEERV
ncbi:MAG: hypothetical protein LBG25_06380 [Spirochaetaceae bacterium]|jgi:hypothetical protein|nr:hypothetical protein [Spirochaetaceae bacterium]